MVSLILLGQDQSNSKTISRPDIPGELLFDLGLNYWDETPQGLNQKGWPSKSVALYYMRRRPFGGKLSLNYGIGLGLEKIDFGSDSTLNTGDPTEVVALELESVSKNRLATTYLDVPIEFRFHPKGTEDGEGFFIGVGAIGGLRMSSHTKLKFDEDGQTKIQKNKARFNLNNWRYGYQVRLGFRGIHLFWKSFLSDTFKGEVGGVNPLQTTVGINITGF